MQEKQKLEKTQKYFYGPYFSIYLLKVKQSSGVIFLNMPPHKRILEPASNCNHSVIVITNIVDLKGG